LDRGSAQHPGAVADGTVAGNRDLVVLDLGVFPQQAAADARAGKPNLARDLRSAQHPRAAEPHAVGEHGRVARMVDLDAVHGERLADIGSAQTQLAVKRGPRDEHRAFDDDAVRLQGARDVAFVEGHSLQGGVAQRDGRLRSLDGVELAALEYQWACHMAALEIEAALDRRVEEDDADGRERGIGHLSADQRAEHPGPDRLPVQVERAAGEHRIQPKTFGRRQIAALKVLRIQHHQHPMRRPGKPPELCQKSASVGRPPQRLIHGGALFTRGRVRKRVPEATAQGATSSWSREERASPRDVCRQVGGPSI
jgi:hypothetical protein